MQAVHLPDWGDKMMSGLKVVSEFTKLEGRTWIRRLEKWSSHVSALHCSAGKSAWLTVSSLRSTSVRRCRSPKVCGEIHTPLKKGERP